jgi:environmental stress-induced protein Ves
MSAVTLTALPPEGFRRTPWKNGGGITIDIADAYRPGATAGGWEGMIWRFGRTAITTPAPFSDLTGFERMQMVVVGSGLVLETPDGEIDVRTPFSPVRYDGGTPIVSRLENGPVEVVNLIADRDLCEIDLKATQAAASLSLGPGTHILYAAQALVEAMIGSKAIRLDIGHAVRIDARDALTLTVSDGMAIIASIRLRPPLP